MKKLKNHNHGSLKIIYLYKTSQHDKKESRFIRKKIFPS